MPWFCRLPSKFAQCSAAAIGPDPLMLSVSLGLTGGHLTGYSPLNPARNIAAALIFKCFADLHVYLLAQMAAAGLAALWVVFHSGKGYFFGGESGHRRPCFARSPPDSMVSCFGRSGFLWAVLHTVRASGSTVSTIHCIDLVVCLPP